MDKYEWHKWFAWHPVRLDNMGDGDLIWLETIERRKETRGYYGGCWSGWVYRNRIR